MLDGGRAFDPPEVAGPEEEPGGGPRTLSLSVSGEEDEDTEPGRLGARVGEQVVLRIATDVPLDLELDGEPVRLDAGPDEPAELGFTPSEPGSYELRDRRSDALIATIEVRP